MPVVTVLLTRLGLLKARWLKAARKVMIVVIFFIAAVITPPDVVSQVMVAIPMIGLYQISIALCALFEKKKDGEET
jgi:sec-independent protein translocase protein TatC